MPSATPPFTPFPLSPFDHLFPPILYAVAAFYFSVDECSCIEEMVQDLERGIERLAEIVPFLRGVVAPAYVEGKVGVMGVQPATQSDEGLEIVRVRYYREYGLPLEGGSGILKGGGGEECTGRYATPRLMPEELLDRDMRGPAPVFRAQINVLADGVALVLAVNHMVVDGTGNDMLLRLLARCCRDPLSAEWPAASATAQVDARRYLDMLGRGGDVGGTLPRTAAGSVSSEDGNYGKEEEEEEEDGRTKEGGYARGEGLTPEESSEFYNFRFDAARIHMLKVECNARLPALRQKLASLEDEKTHREKLPDFVSSTDVLMAVLWMCAAPAITEQQKTCTLGCAVDSRKKFPRALAHEFLGNTVAYGEAEMFLSELRGLKMGDGGGGDDDEEEDEEVNDSTLELLTRISYRIRCCIADLDGPSLSQITASYSENADWSQIVLKRCDFIVSSLREWGLFGLDFGPRVGRVRNMECLPPCSTTGECLVKPRRCAEDRGQEKEGKNDAWEVMVTLRPDQVEHMCQAQLLRWLMEGVSQIQFYRCL